MKLGLPQTLDQLKKPTGKLRAFFLTMLEQSLMQPNTLDAKLEQYSSTAKGQTPRAKSAADLVGYAAAAGASLAMAGSADAAIIYSGVQNITVQIDPSVQATTSSFSNTQTAPLNIGGSPFLIVAGNGAYTSFPTVLYGGGAFILAPTGAYFLGTSSGGKGGAFLSASHADIGPGGVFSATGVGQSRFAAASTGAGTFYSYNKNNFLPGATGIAGFQLANGDFGWIRLRVDELGLNQPFSNFFGGNPVGNGQDYADKITVIDWAYESCSGVPIHAGDTTGGPSTCPASVPEPSPLALLAVGATGVSAFRRRRAAQAAH